MSDRVDPIGRAPIAESDGKPTPFFARQWQNLIGLVKSVATLDEEAKSALERIVANEEAIDDISAREVIAGDALDGGGPLGGPGDIEIDHAQSGVTPGQYGDATNVPQIDVNAFGHITNVQNVPISGGGGGGGGSELDFGPPLIANFPNTFTATGVTLTPSDVSGKGLHILINDSSGGNRAGLITKAVPTAPWEITTRLLRTPDGNLSSGSTNDFSIGLVAYNSSTGAFLTGYLGNAGYVFQRWSALVLGSATTFGTLSRSGGSEIGPAVWLRLADDGSDNLNAQFSNDGVTFYNIAAPQSITAQIGSITHIGFFFSIGKTGDMSALIPYYNQT